MGRGDEFHGEEEDDDRQFRIWRGGRGAMAERGWCAGCGRDLVEAFLCDACGLSSGIYAARFYDDRQSPTATAISRVRQRAIGDAAAYEQMIQLQTVCDASVQPIDGRGETARSDKIRSMRVNASGGILSRDEREAIKRTSGLNLGSALNKSRPRVRFRFRLFAEMWTRVAWQLIDDLTCSETDRVLRLIARQDVGPA